MAVRNPLVAPVFGHQLSAPHLTATHVPGPHLTGSSAAAQHAAPPARGSAAEAGTRLDAETVLGHRFARPELLREALTHRSAAGGRRGEKALKGAGSNERLEFVGDRVLGLLVAEWLAERFPREQEGDLGRRLATLVSQPVLAALSEQVGLPALLSVAPGESRAGVRKRATVLADAMEAAIGALFLDGGLDAARRFVRHTWDAAMIAQANPPKDAKTALQEWAQKRSLPLPVYRVVSSEGPPHAPMFVIAVDVGAESGTGTAGSKRAAEQAAAEDLMHKLAHPHGAKPKLAPEAAS